MFSSFKAIHEVIVMNRRYGVFIAILCSIVCGGAGCGLPKQWHSAADKLPQATPDNPVVDMFCVWEAAEGQGPDGLPTRGFAGKITFFTRKVPTGVRVDGDVRVYVFDDQSPPEERSKPIHQWDFIGDAWKIHLQNSSLGPSYSVFIPYTRKGGRQANCALRVRLTPPVGAPLYSETVAVLMPGTKTKPAETPVRRPPADKRNSLDSITIPLKEKQGFDFSQMPAGQVAGATRDGPGFGIASAQRRSLSEGRVSGETGLGTGPEKRDVPAARTGPAGTTRDFLSPRANPIRRESLAGGENSGNGARGTAGVNASAADAAEPVQCETTRQAVALGPLHGGRALGRIPPLPRGLHSHPLVHHPVGE